MWFGWTWYLKGEVLSYELHCPKTRSTASWFQRVSWRMRRCCCRSPHRRSWEDSARSQIPTLVTHRHQYRDEQCWWVGRLDSQRGHNRVWDKQGPVLGNLLLCVQPGNTTGRGRSSRMGPNGITSFKQVLCYSNTLNLGVLQWFLIHVNKQQMEG